MLSVSYVTSFEIEISDIVGIKVEEKRKTDLY